MRSFIFGSVFIITLLLLLSCNSNYTPRPKGYHHIDFPERGYQVFDEAGYPYAFEYPVYATISREKDTTGNSPYWINVDFDQFKARIYISYKSIGGKSVYKIKTVDGYKDSIIKNTFEGLREESYKMTYKHSIKASGIVDSPFVSTFGSSGMYFYVAGEAATSRQFYITDTSRHFLRGALYFDVTPNSDSISVVSDFIEKDMRHLIETFKWR
ncbi:MAG: hypothetical protein ACK5AO_10500 [bacterium]|jgi:gliding motility-associated lipoprotein GldD